MQAQPHAIVGAELGFVATRAEALAIWEAAAARWHQVVGRPTEGDVSVYRALAANRLCGRVLVLGVTPELRDLIAQAGARPLVVDMSRAMHEATTRMLRHADPARETWMEADWCEADLASDSFDLVVGDLVWWALSVRRQHALRDTIHRILRPDGLFVGRVRFSEPGRAQLDPGDAVARHLERLSGPRADADLIQRELLDWLYDHTADHHARRLNRGRAHCLLNELAAAPRFNQHARFLREATARLVGSDWTSQPREEVLDLLGTRFELVAEERAVDYHSSQHPILALRPR